MPFAKESFIAAAKAAAASDDPTRAVRELLAETVRDPAPIKAAFAHVEADEENFYEDETLSLWMTRFQPHQVLPPHDHGVSVHIAVYSGVERNLLYRRPKEGGGLGEPIVRETPAGELLSLGPDGIHAPTAAGDGPSEALHVYMGKLSTVERSLFDWDTGRTVPFTMERFEGLVRPKGDVPGA
ncbi:MAG: hypothetical protein RIB45_01790 [Marivibrio sp.]|uniref:hypothetical protein n=1 Tax=Marivibrio sp. TaxID=2039719 RepID=UPI0032EBA4B7